MGWNSAYAILEAHVVGAYDLGKLDESLLRVLMEPYRKGDVDHGGAAYLQAQDGLECDEIIVKILWPEEFEKCQRAFPERESDDYRDAIYDAWSRGTGREFQYW